MYVNSAKISNNARTRLQKLFNNNCANNTHDVVHVLVMNLEHNHDEMWLATLTNAHCVLQMVNCSVNHINKIDGEDSSYSYSENQFTTK